MLSLPISLTNDVLIAGVAWNIMGKSNAGVRIYQLTYIVGFFSSILLYTLACRIWPPAGLGISEDFPESPEVIQGLQYETDGTGDQNATEKSLNDKAIISEV